MKRFKYQKINTFLAILTLNIFYYLILKNMISIRNKGGGLHFNILSKKIQTLKTPHIIIILTMNNGNE